MKRITSIVLVLFCLVGFEVFGQTINVATADLPIVICSSQRNFKYQDNEYSYTRVQWVVTGGIVESTSGVGDVNASIRFTGNGSIKVKLYNVNSFVAEVGPYPVTVSNAGEISPNSNLVCSGSSVTLFCSDCIGTVTWYSRPTGGSSWTSFGTSTDNANKTSPSITQSTEFKATVCNQAATSNIAVVNLWNAPTPGTINAASDVCSGSSPGVLGNGTSPTGSNLTYQWFQTLNGGSWVVVPGATGITYTVPNITVSSKTTYQFRRQTSGCNGPTVVSNTISFSVHPSSSIGTLTVSTNTICTSGTTTLNLSGYTATGLTTKIRYSDDNLNTWTSWVDFTYSVFTSISTGTLTTNGVANRTYQFQTIASSGPCASVSSNVVSITVYATNGGSISPSSPQAIGSASGTLTLNSYSGSVVRWEQKVGSGNWTTVLITTSPTYSYSNVTTTTLYRAFTKNSTCSEQSSVSTAQVTVYPIEITAQKQYLGYGVISYLNATNGFSSYQWILNDQDIPGATQSYYATKQPGTYKVKVTKPAMTAYTTPGFDVQPLINLNKSIGLDYQLFSEFRNTASTTRILKEGVKPNSNLFELGMGQVLQNVTYSDGFGRPFQKIAIGQSTIGFDIVQPFVYNANGLVEKQYLPYVPEDNLGYPRYDAVIARDPYPESEHESFYSGDGEYFPEGSYKVAIDNHPYATIGYAASMTGRVRESGAPGEAWQPGSGHTVKNDLVTNASNEVRIWKANLTTTEYYAAGKLAVTQVTDENGNKVRTYTDKLGKTILKKVQADASTWLDTYYIYDVYNRLICQVPPKAITTLGSGSSLDANASSVSELIFIYKYDERDRLTEKKVPGASVQYFVYDKRDRLILTQDGNLRASNKWSYVKYDGKDRPVMTGIIVDATRTTLSAMQSYVTTQLDVATPFESRGTALQGYTNTVFPIVTETDILTVNYFDNYDFDWNGTADYNYTQQGLTGEGTQASAFGMPTGSKSKILGTTDYLINVSFYDTWHRPIQKLSNNHRRLTVDNTATLVYDFAGKILLSKIYVDAGTPVTIKNRMTYDHAGRPEKVFQQIDSESEREVVAYYFNQLGQLVQKVLDSGTSGSQFVDYRYNIRGWLTSINNASLSQDETNTYGSINDYFGMELLYNTTDNTLANYPSYNGNASAIKWKGPGATGQQDRSAYLYSYDKADRLTTGQFKKYGVSAWNQQVNTLNEQIAYDENGNITSLTRIQNKRGLSGLNVTSTPQTIDALTYTYTQGNQISKIEDTGTEAGFINGAVNGSNEYTYNANGNLTADKNKGIDSIKYNDIGKAVRIKYTDGRVQTFRYAASGEKISSKTYSTAGVLQVNNEYTGGIQYENSELMYLPNPEGRVTRYGQSIMDGRGHGTTTTGTTTQYSNVSAITQNGESYLKVIGNNSSLVSPGIVLSASWPVQAGKKYILKAKGYVQQTSTYQPTIQVKSNLSGTLLLNTTSPLLPKGSANEDWIAVEFTVPSGATSISFGVFWDSSQSIPIGTEFYLNEIELKTLVNDYQYAIKDHQGNTRVMFSSTTPTPVVSIANMEDTEQSEFPNYQNCYRSSNALYNSTPGGTYSNLLNGGYNGKIGVAKSYKVYPGDKVKIEAKAKYMGVQRLDNANVTVLAAGLLSAFGLTPPVVGETGTAAAGLNSYGVAVQNATDPESDDITAYVNILVFDKQHNFLDVAYDIMDASAAQNGVSPVTPHDNLMREYTVKEEGYVYMYVSNESSKLFDVYFDDIKMTYTPGKVIQYNEYYPFGMRTANSWDRSEGGAIVNKYQYNSSSELNTTANWYETMFREYDPVIGRMNGVDMMASKFGSVSPYNYSFNNPIIFSDPSGAAPLYSYTEMYMLGQYAGGRFQIKDTGVFGGSGGYGRGDFFEKGWAPGSNSLSANAFKRQDDMIFLNQALVALTTPTNQYSFVLGQNGFFQGYNVLTNVFGNILSIARDNKVIKSTIGAWISTGDTIGIDLTTNNNLQASVKANAVPSEATSQEPIGGYGWGFNIASSLQVTSGKSNIDATFKNGIGITHRQGAKVITEVSSSTKYGGSRQNPNTVKYINEGGFSFVGGVAYSETLEMDNFGNSIGKETQLNVGAAGIAGFQINWVNGAVKDFRIGLDGGIGGAIGVGAKVNLQLGLIYVFEP